MKNIFLTIVIPCYNEEANLKRGVLSEVRSFLKAKDFSWEVIVSDDGSTDESRELARKEIKNWRNFKLLENSHAGKPSALWSGIKVSKGTFVLFSDMDQSTPIGEIDKLLPLIKVSNVVIGSRGLGRKNFPLYRKIGAVVFMKLRKFMILSEINDTQCGFKLFNRKLVMKAFSKLGVLNKEEEVRGWKVTSYDVELLHILKKMGAKIKEVEVSWNDKDISKSKGGGVVCYILESKEMLNQIIRVKINDTKGLYRYTKHI
ncbi:hypothetical protein A2686_00800 [Candidatus Woesebacteria bacterium RIFCSPHIGHO2_01_FULL_38_10]|uniref:Glycosyltransferase 2-like domain-containing protein n=1 Tax=Candidatus Woesebacteria bacterium RIFCSPLOWO2_01_FULL_39_10b TaxID=1802517 RepID=A0A1F8BB88_9BACT|nr:MAG: hypothetical protein A2686_00800 [Candidatus Woesebacteria bacterium RIFCSPHIGHO2_01_FULL_38_10]OGM60645.1 MAG: hypothetical protein A2892_01195 [Candidatus Woesebacteria bacterium RIFCSPLOWO2_01_FULL_39_10b]